MNNNDMSILSLVTNASVLVQFVMAGLLAISIASWTVIFRKGFQIRAARAATERFESEFWRPGDLHALFTPGDHGPLARIFESGMREFLKTRQQKPGDANAMLEAARRAMRAAYQREMDALESSLAFLASAGSVSPYIGLFGTVIGIMNSFRNIAAQGETNLTVVAPGIAEALFATALGLFAAIPALIFYNKFSADVSAFSDRLTNFAQEVSARLSKRLNERRDV